MNEQHIAERVARSVVSGEDWILSEGINKLVPQVVHEIQSRGGRCIGQAATGRIKAQKFVLDAEHGIPIEIQFWEGDWSHDVIIIGSFGGGHRLPLLSAKFDAKVIVDKIRDTFMDLVNRKG
jgi:hypothetical protein